MIQQTSFHIPADVMEGLSKGELVRYGGVARQATGEIYKHLKEIDVPAEASHRSLQVP